MGGAKAEHAAVTRGDADGAARVGAEGEVDESRGDGGDRSTGRASGQAVGETRIEGRAVVDVDAVEAEGQLVGARLADEGRAGIEQPAHGGRRLGGNRVGALPVGVAGARRVAGHVVEVLDHERRSGERSTGLPGEGQPAHDAVEGACRGSTMERSRPAIVPERIGEVNRRGGPPRLTPGRTPRYLFTREGETPREERA